MQEKKERDVGGWPLKKKKKLRYVEVEVQRNWTMPSAQSQATDDVSAATRL